MKDSKRNKINLIFSSFLIIGYVICTYFFNSLATQVSGTIGSLIQVLIFVLFGLLLFYATRVGEGVQVKRFSLAVLLLVDLPALYILLATFVEGLPFHDQLTGAGALPTVFILAGIALGYGIPFTFVSGYELETEEESDDDADDSPVEGGLIEDLTDAEEEKAEEVAEEIKEEATEEIADPDDTEDSDESDDASEE